MQIVSNLHEISIPAFWKKYFSIITKTRLFKYTENITTKKWNFSDKKKTDVFHISAQNVEAFLTSTYNLCFEQK